MLPKRGFLPWRLSDAGRRICGPVLHAADIRNPSHKQPITLKRVTSALPCGADVYDNTS
ncbi:protein of unknown function [Bradyrhizobium vignae]|uniref:Uncharacterized protein n=1 Tax=Bradyrhizobium vignae TaxID=1549949 RepID=A0A2U3PS37_9BRAD|nr:protein of unknown function [Bradyrhizobium vignae]